MLTAIAWAADGPPQILDLTYRPTPFHAESGIQVFPRLLDGEEATVTFSCRWFVNGEENEEVQDRLLSGDYFQRGDMIAVEVTPERDGQQGMPVLSGEVEAGNAPPQMVSRPPENLASGLYNYALEAVDADGDVLTYALLDAPSGMQLDEARGLLSWNIAFWQQGPVTVVVAVEDGFGGQDQQQFSMNPTFVRNEGLINE